MNTYRVTIERNTDGARFTRMIRCTDPTSALREAYAQLRTEADGYYVLLVELV